MLLEQTGSERLELHVLLFAERDVVLLQHHHLYDHLVLLRGEVLRSARRRELRLDVLLRRRQLVHERAELLQLRDEKRLKRARRVGGGGDRFLAGVSAGEPRRRRRRHGALELHQLLLLDGRGSSHLLPERVELLLGRKRRAPLRRLERRSRGASAAGAEQRRRHRRRAGEHLRLLHGGGAIAHAFRAF